MASATFNANLQQLWADMAIEELIRCGVTSFCIAPGSRSTPLALAVAGNTQARHLVHYDERGLGFYAMALAAASGGNAAVITTSGTAVANLLPAIVEASKKKVPLIIMTADRPPELRQTGANQTITQPGIFGVYVRWECDMGVPTAAIDPSVVLTTMDQAVFRSRGELPGPVHINWMFREPFAVHGPKKAGSKTLPFSVRQWRQASEPYTRYAASQPQITGADVAAAADRIKSAHSGVIVVGKLSGPPAARQVVRLAEKLGWPVLPDITSGLRLGTPSPVVINHFQYILSQVKFSADVVLHLGGRITAKSYYDWVRGEPVSEYIMVLNHPLRNDPHHRVTLRIQGCPGEFAKKLAGSVNKRPAGNSLKVWQRANAQAVRIIDEYFNGLEELSEAAVVRAVSRLVPRSQGLFVSNSLPVRELDAYADGSVGEVPVGANRGASGIDGIIASAAGYGEGVGKRITLLIGDLAFLHDMNSLALLDKITQPMVIIILNNDGGGIFEFLPIRKNSKDFEPFFAAPHGLRFADTARQFGLDYACPKDLGEFTQVYRNAVRAERSIIIEAVTERKVNCRVQRELSSRIKKTLSTKERG